MEPSTADRLPGWARGWSRRRLLGSAAVIALVVVLAVSCLGGAGGRADVPVLGDGPDAGVEGVRSPSDERGGTLRVVAPTLDSLDPQRSYLPGVWNLMRLYARTLVTFASAPGGTTELVPDLATDLGTVSEDGLSWTFTLKEGVRFESGRPITSGDVKYGIQRSFASDVIVGGPTYLVGLLDDPANPYPGPYSTEEDDPVLSSIETPDERTIVFRLRAPQPDLPYVLALPSASPVPAEADTRGEYGADPVSSGPYAVSSVDPETGILLERNPEWDPSTDEVRTALPDAVVVRTGLSGLARDQALLAGSADLDLSGTGVMPATTARLAGDGGEELLDRVDDVTTGAVRLLALPTDVVPMDDAGCRAAVAAAIDRRGIQEALGGAVDAVRSSTLWPRALAGGPDAGELEPDLDAARAALEECGRPDGFTTVLAVPDVSSSVDVAEEIAAQLAEVRIDVEVRPLDPATFYATDVGNPDNVAASGYGLVLATRTADFPTPGSFLVPLVDGRSIARVGNPNYARLADPEIDSLVDRARAGDARWAEVAAAAQDRAAYVPLAETRIQLLAGQRLRNGLVMRPYDGYDVATAGVR
ncbi:ABC transporter substrate-binding protein [Blastococcus sp. MG754426]|uniref:ABC transporter substrate-binding protein n=1 Tax=unclassified Blastococcus TaxID=2619396 RepID=UPI001EEFF691|nr:MULTISPECIES: ABC transporter substrate-binding protein [unclassified Blastococcus]MCF6508029.1 ABC transporter substrate-binding protein [Blastococcus sp. MG754426]MCF6512799.1 ABC transporter substrate-binding protein [Blastococcus sp. MG754427]MCF6736199.1 ABC transporter substrate-binding protein [Blastococcus sp. KM273129]